MTVNIVWIIIALAVILVTIVEAIALAKRARRHRTTRRPRAGTS
jgi:hypothetical protein